MKKPSVFVALLKSAGYVILMFAAQILASLLSQIVVTFRAGMEGISPDVILKNLQTVLHSLTYETLFLSAVIFAAILHLIHKKRAFEPFCGPKMPASLLFGTVLLGLGCYWLAGQLIALASHFPAFSAAKDAYAEQQNAILNSAPNFLFEILYTCLGAPIIEEWLCRGMIQNTLKKSMRPAFAIFLSGLIFALIHGNLYQMVFTLPFGILLGYFAHRFGSIIPSILLHAAFNFANYPVRTGLYLGYGENDKITLFFYGASAIFYILSLPLGLILLRDGIKAFSEKNSPQKNLQNRQGEIPMAAPEYIIVGLGNPESKYLRNRHNCGFLAIDHIAEAFGAKIQNLRFSALSGEAIIAGKKVLLLKPQTYMNLSGKAVREAADFYKIPPQNILVLFDDISFAPGIFRIREKGSAGGHNGIKNIIFSLSSDAFPRVKIGVGTPPAGWELMNWVLGNPSAEDEAKIRATFPDIAKTASLFAEGKLELAAASFNGKMHE